MLLRSVQGILLLMFHTSQAFFEGEFEDLQLLKRNLDAKIFESYDLPHLDWEKLLKNIDSKFIKSLEDSGNQCQIDTAAYIKGLNYSNPLGVKGWALKMFDATGKLPPAGSFEGGLINLPGNVNSCLEVDSGTFLGKFFASTLIKNPVGRGSLAGLSEHLRKSMIPDPNSLFKDHLAKHSPFLALNKRNKTDADPRMWILEMVAGTMRIGLCFPSSCTEGEHGDLVGVLYQLFVIQNGLSVFPFPSSAKDINSEIEWTSWDHFALAVVCILLALVGLGTLLDITLRHGAYPYLPHALSLTFQGFSLYTVMRKIFHVSVNKDGLASINGIRFWSMVWVIVGHTYLVFQSFPPPAINPGFVYTDLSEMKSMRIINNATVSVDSFFLIGGVLLAYMTIKELNKTKGGSIKLWIMFYVHRYIRLTAPLAAWVLLSATLIKFLPYSLINYWNTEGCSKDGWANLIYANNFEHDKCLGQTWYLAVEMQMFIFTPFLLYPMYRFPIIGNVIVGALIIVSTILRGVVWNQVFDGKEIDFMQDIYTKPWYRFGAYGVGLMFGSLLFQLKDKQLKGNVWKIVMAVGWIVSLTTIFLIIYAYDPSSQEKGIAIPYQVMHRTAWAIAVGFMIFASAKGYGGPVGAFLEWGAFAPLAKMTYSAYLIHFLVLVYFTARCSYRIYISQTLIVFMCITNVIVSMGVGLASALLFEAPIMHLEKLLFGILGVSKLPAVNKYKTE